MTIEEKISQAKAKLLVDYPYFGTLATKLQLKVNDDIESFRCSATTLEYREEYLGEVTIDELEFIFANGAMHATLAHDKRRSKRSGWLWQMATDMAINDMLVTNGMQLPYGAHYRKRFEGMYAEEIYEELKSDILRADEDLEYEADSFDDLEQPNEEQSKLQSQEQIAEEILTEQLFAEEAIALLESQLQRGEAPETIERFFDISHLSSVDWRWELRGAIDHYARDDYTLLPPSKKLLYSGIYLPSHISQTFKLVVVVDSSASIDEGLLNLFLSELSFLLSMIEKYSVDIIICDDRVHSHKTYEQGEALEASIKGGGGTDFRVAFQYVDKEIDDVKLLLYFTDLEGIFPVASPEYEVKWVTQKREEVPFGSLIVLNDSV